MKQFKRTDTYLFRCAPELKEALKAMKMSFWSESDVIHEAIARMYRTHLMNHLPTMEDKMLFCDQLAELDGMKERRDKEKSRKKYYSEKNLRLGLIK